MTAGSEIVPPPYILPQQGGIEISYSTDYYFEEGNVIIQVENTLFKVWDLPLRRHSRFFADKITKHNASRQSEQEPPPLVLEDVQSIDFERLLWIIFPPVIGEYRAKIAEEWISILGLACLWSFNDIRNLCINKLGEIELDPFQKIGLQQKHDIKAQWAYSSFITLCSRNEPLSIEEARVLGLEVTVKIAAVRERLEKWGRKKVEDVQKQVCDAFGLQPEK